MSFTHSSRTLGEAACCWSQPGLHLAASRCYGVVVLLPAFSHADLSLPSVPLSFLQPDLSWKSSQRGKIRSTGSAELTWCLPQPRWERSFLPNTHEPDPTGIWDLVRFVLKLLVWRGCSAASLTGTDPEHQLSPC